MIPVQLHIAGFLSYRDPVELDFTKFDLACISGQNGAGKSSLLDAITWALFGQARRRDDSLINLQSKTAEVTFTFSYEGNVFRVQRALPRGKTSILEFQILEPTAAIDSKLPTSDSRLPNNGNWKPLTERTLRETQVRIEQTLRLDYETFVNAAFFLQGKADQFTQQTPSKRKDVLSSILGLDAWETYKVRTSEKRRVFEDEVLAVDRHIAEIDGELAEAEPRKQRLAELETELQHLTAARKVQETALESIKSAAASREQQRKLVATLGTALERSRSQLSTLCDRLTEREAARAIHADLISRADKIELAHQAWQKTRLALEQWDQTASAFRDHEQRRAPLLERIAAEQARLEEEQRSLLIDEVEMENQQSSIKDLKSESENAQQLLNQAKAKVAERAQLDAERSAARETQVGLKAENDALKIEMDTLKSRIASLESTDGAACPLCGQPLTAAHRKSTLKALQAEGKEKGDRFRANKVAIIDLDAAVKNLDFRLIGLTSAPDDQLAYSNAVTQLEERIQNLQSVSKSWESTGRKRLKEVNAALSEGKYAQDIQKQLAKLDKELAKLGYDAAAHDDIRRMELEQRTADDEHHQLELARAAVAPLESEIANLRSEIDKRKSEIENQDAEFQTAQASLEIAQTQSPNIDEAERALFDLQEQENRLHQEVGAARQKVSVLDDLRERKRGLVDSRQVLALQISQHKMLERAFGKDGVPALLMEQALPQIESKANELLDRLSDGQMSVSFVTQAGYKDKKREDLKETLDIRISDGAGPRDYEMYSGGEAFRVDFAIRLALAEVLAQRKGARLQTLVIDEGFGSQDIQGRQRLLEAINLIKQDFAKILVITHLEELKDAFPTRIEVEKTDRGSTVRVM